MNLLPVFLTGLMGAAHCIGMCGGIVSAFSLTTGVARREAASAPAPAFNLVGAPRRVYPSLASIPVSVAPKAAQIAGSGVMNLVAFNTGRLLSYAIAGAVAGGLAGGLVGWLHVSTLQSVGYALANLMLIVIGLFLMDVWRGLSALESVGQRIWQRIRPALRFVLPVDHPAKALLLGGIWGWMPCGMVYSVLVTAMLAGSAVQGAEVMLAFGLGTVPAVLGAGLAGNGLRAWLRRPLVRRLAGTLVLGFGVLGLLRLTQGVGPAWLDVFCLTPSGAHL